MINFNVIPQTAVVAELTASIRIIVFNKTAKAEVKYTRKGCSSSSYKTTIKMQRGSNNADAFDVVFTKAVGCLPRTAAITTVAVTGILSNVVLDVLRDTDFIESNGITHRLGAIEHYGVDGSILL